MERMSSSVAYAQCDERNFLCSPLSPYILTVLNTLLFSQDSRLVSTLQSVCSNAGINPAVCSEVPKAASMLARNKFYGVIVDGSEAAREILSLFQTSSSSRKAISIVVSDGSAGTPIGTFVLRKPVSVELVARTLHAAKGPMLNEFQQYYRHSAQLPVLITRDSGGEFQATSINLSRRGLAIQMSGTGVIAPKDAVRARVATPSGGSWIDTKGEVVWANTRGSAGIRCEGVSPRDRQLLEEIAASGSTVGG
jgi:hypothetical protein